MGKVYLSRLTLSILLVGLWSLVVCGVPSAWALQKGEIISITGTVKQVNADGSYLFKPIGAKTSVTIAGTIPATWTWSDTDTGGCWQVQLPYACPPK